MGRNTQSSYLNISEEFKAFYWSPGKTGSVHAAAIFACLPFEFIECSYDRKSIYNFHEIASHSHRMDLFEGHENYILICTARNPIHRLFSSFVYVNRFKDELNPKDFRPFLINCIDNNEFLWTGSIKNPPREPDYYVRLENLYDDYMKLPFMPTTKFASCGVLEELCGRKKNETKKFNITIQECYTDDMIDYVYTEYRDYFDKLGYEPKL